MKTGLFHAWKRAVLQGTETTPDYPVPNMRDHFMRAIYLYTSAEVDKLREDEQRSAYLEYEEDVKRYGKDARMRWDDPNSHSYLNLEDFGSFSTDTLEMINKCRLPGLYSFLRRAPKEPQLRSVMHFMAQPENRNVEFPAASNAITAIKRAFDFGDIEDFAELDESIACGVHAATRFLAENRPILAYAPLMADPVMRDPECAERVKEYASSYFPEERDMAGFDLDHLYNYLKNPAPVLAGGEL